MCAPTKKERGPWWEREIDWVKVPSRPADLWLIQSARDSFPPAQILCPSLVPQLVPTHPGLTILGASPLTILLCPTSSRHFFVPSHFGTPCTLTAQRPPLLCPSLFPLTAQRPHFCVPSCSDSLHRDPTSLSQLVPPDSLHRDPTSVSQLVPTVCTETPLLCPSLFRLTAQRPHFCVPACSD